MSYTLKSGDAGLALFYHSAFLEHDTGDHPESPQRLRAILAELERHGVPESALLEPQPVDLGLLGEVHDPRYAAVLERASAQGGGYWDLDTYISPGSYRAATLAAGASVAAVDSAMSGRNGFALVRPPGHHALYDSAMGFCLFNNVAVAAQNALRKHGLERVIVVDWDVHHGNGTQDYFYERDDVLFFSVHQYPFYPGTGAAGETGAGAGKGYTVNVPLPAGVGDGGYMGVFDEILAPVARRYKPELIVVSAGYDAHMADPLGGMAVSTAGFYSMAERVRRVAEEIPECGGRVACVLEGGYNGQALAASVVATIAAFEKSPQSQEAQDSTRTQPDLYRGRRPPDISRIISEVRRVHGL
jgi:acetoin utilization deacetylase AcuC-like enzyme